MRKFFINYPDVCIGLGCVIALGIGPIFLAELFRRLGFNSIGFGLMWGVSFGPIFMILGLAILIVGGIVRLVKSSNS